MSVDTEREREALVTAVNNLVNKINPPEQTQVLGLGDIVSVGFNGGEYDCATVCKLNDDGTVNLFRPYTHTAGFSYTGGVICYVGIENITHANPDRLRLIRKGTPLK